ncbi:hypothetical protein [Saccharothrix deserti]|nr:hypothetical protein [Saccharothrix deserti]
MRGEGDAQVGVPVSMRRGSVGALSACTVGPLGLDTAGVGEPPRGSAA